VSLVKPLVGFRGGGEVERLLYLGAMWFRCKIV